MRLPLPVANTIASPSSAYQSGTACTEPSPSSVASTPTRRARSSSRTSGSARTALPVSPRLGVGDGVRHPSSGSALVLGEAPPQHAAGEHTDEPATLDDGDALCVVLLEKVEGLVERGVGVDRVVGLLGEIADRGVLADRAPVRPPWRRASSASAPP